MYIAFTGPSSSGKTTTLNKLKEKLIANGYNVATVTNVVRNTLENLNLTLQDIRCDYEKVARFQEYIIQTQLMEEYLKKEQSCDFIITDRAVPYDYIVYSLMFMKLEDSITYCKKYLREKRYDMIFYFEPLEFDNDGVRDKNTRNDEIVLYDTIIKKECNYVLPCISIDKRVDMIYNIITEGYNDRFEQ